MIITCFAFAGCKMDKRVLPPLSESYRKTDMQPFGGYIAYKEFRRFYNNRYIETVNEPFDEEWQTIRDYTEDKKYSLYFLIAKNLVLTPTEVDAFLDYVKQGNDLFISADYVDSRLLENIGCSNERTAEIMDELQGRMYNTKVRMFFGNDYYGPSYGYYYFPFLNSLTGFDTSFVRILGVNEKNLPNYLILFYGKGRIYLHVAPRVFSNYFLLSSENYQYIENVISYLRSDPKDIYWDEYYKNTSPSRRTFGSQRDNGDFSSLSVIKQHPPLLWAFWLAVAGLLLYVLFNSKRKQKVIEEIRPNSNTSVTFAETVGRLYFQRKNNNHIAEKMITYFYENVRNKYFISTANINDEFIHSLSGKSGVPKERVQHLFNLIAAVQLGQDVDDETLLMLNAEIENFYKTQS